MSKDEKKSTKESKKKTTNCPAKKSRPKSEDNIAKSKKLAEKMKICRRNSYLKSSCSSNRTNNDSTRVCDNGKPMPPLSELEKMFEDSDDDEEPKIVTRKENNLPVSSSISSEKLTSPSTIKKIADRMMDMISNLPVSYSDNDYPPPKKRKKNNRLDKDCPNKRIKRNKSDAISESIFNSNSDNVAIWLKDCEKSDHSDGSRDSNKTVDYDLGKTPNVNGRLQSFSPLPSTSRDRETITINDQLFNDSLLSETSTNENKSTAIINETKADSGTDLKPQSNNDNKSLEVNTANDAMIDDDIKIVESPVETIVINDDIEISKPVKRKNIDENDILECIDIVELDIKKGNHRLQDSEAIIIDDDDYYKSIDYSPVRYEVAEVIDIDDIIAENKAIIKKYSRDTNKDINTITCVDSTAISNLNNNEESKIEPNSFNVLNDFDNTVKTNTVIINDESSTTQNNSSQDKLQAIVTNFFTTKPHNESHSEVETPIENAKTSVLQRLTDWLHMLPGNNSAYAHNTSRNDIQNDNNVFIYDISSDDTNNSPTGPDVTTPINLGSEHSSNPHFTSRNNIQNDSVMLSRANENSNRDGYERRCNKNHQHHTSSMHRHIFQNESWHGNMDRSNQINNQHHDVSNTLCKKCHHYHRPERINKRQQTITDSLSSYQLCKKCHHYHRKDDIEERRKRNQHHTSMHRQSRHVSNGSSRINNNQQDYNKTNKLPRTQPSQQPAPVTAQTAANPESPAKNFGDCPICMDSLAKNSVASTICGHVFCLKCIEAALKTSGKKCPTCRKTLKKGGYHQIFL